MSFQRVGRCRPLEARQRDFTLGAAHAHPRHLDLTAAERHLAVDTPAAPRRPLDLVAPLRATQRFPIRLHHRLQDLQPGRDAQAMERFPDTVDHAEHRQRHLDGAGTVEPAHVAGHGTDREDSALHTSGEAATRRRPQPAAYPAGRLA